LVPTWPEPEALAVLELANLRAGPAAHQAAVRRALVGIGHGCLAQRVAYQEQLAWPAACLDRG
jgi:hypothetical protein